MVSLIPAFHEHQISVYIRKILQDITSKEVTLWDPKHTYSCFIFKRRVVTVSLENKKFKVRITGRAGKHYVVFCYKTNGFNQNNFLKGTKRFLKAVFNKDPDNKQTRKTFKYISAKNGADITELNTDYLLIIERLAVNQWFTRTSCLACDFVAP